MIALGFALGLAAAAMVFLGAAVLRLADTAARLAGAVETHGNVLTKLGRALADASDRTIADPEGSARLADSDAARPSVRP